MAKSQPKPKHVDRLYIRCTFCKQIHLLCRTNANTSQFADWTGLEAFLRKHLNCNPWYQGENLLGVPGFEVFAWSECMIDRGSSTGPPISFKVTWDEIDKLVPGAKRIFEDSDDFEDDPDS